MFMWLTEKIRKNKKGFTLIELIVVIAILGILAMIAIPRLAGFRDSAAISADRTSAAVIAKAAEAYAAANNFTEAQRDAFTSISDLEDADLLTSTDTDPQSSASSFVLDYSTATGEFTVSLDSTVLYPH